MGAVRLTTVVIGSGRSGTAWAAKQLTEQGVPCGHESVFDWHPSSQPDRRLSYAGRTPSPHEPAPDVELLAESSLAAIAHLSELPEGCRVWHVVRHPLDVVSSWAASGILDDPLSSPYGRFMVAHVPELAAETNPVGRAARWVAEWNLRGQRAALALGMPYRLTAVESGEQVVNHHGWKPPLTVEDLHESCGMTTARLLSEWAEATGYLW